MARRVRRSLGAVLVLSAALSAGLLGVSSAPASAATVATWSGIGAVLPANSDPGNQAELMTTSCPAPGNCVAAGMYLAGGLPEGFIDTQSGGTWSATEAPMPANAAASPHPALTSLACPSVGSCTAVGIYKDTGGYNQGLLLSLTGGVWSATEAPLPPGAAADPSVSIYTVSCGAPGACVAAGSYGDGGANTQGLLLNLSGGVWSATEAPLPPGAAASQGVQQLATSCGGPGSCMAIGHYNDGAAHAQGLLLTLAGGAWSATEAPLPSDAGPVPHVTLIGASCPAAGSCTVVGVYEDASSNVHSLIESVSNGTATVTEAPHPADAKTSGSSPNPSSALYGVSCPSTQFCVATGTYVKTTGTGSVPLIETFTGGAWAPSAGAGSFDPAAQSIPVGVSCSWPGSCSAVGMSGGGGSTSGFIETLAGGTWTETAAVLPSDATVPNSMMWGLGELAASAISCVAGTCSTTGSYATASGYGGFIDSSPGLTGYQLAASDGGIFAFNAPFSGSMGGTPLNQPIVGMAAEPDTGGYYEVASDGGIFAFGAPFQGSMGGHPLNQPVVGIAFDSRTGGYYEVASDGGIFAFGAPFQGSMGGQHLNKPIVGIAFDSATGGYYEVASDGGIFAFGAPFSGSMGATPLNQPIVGMTFDSATGGYYEVASDGGIFAFGAPFQGSMGAVALNKPVVGMAFDFVTGGYYEVASDGGIFAFGAPFSGSMGGQHLNKPIVGMSFG